MTNDESIIQYIKSTSTMLLNTAQNMDRNADDIDLSMFCKHLTDAIAEIPQPTERLRDLYSDLYDYYART